MACCVANVASHFSRSIRFARTFATASFSVDNRLNMQILLKRERYKNAILARSEDELGGTSDNHMSSPKGTPMSRNLSSLGATSFADTVLSTPHIFPNSEFPESGKSVSFRFAAPVWYGRIMCPKLGRQGGFREHVRRDGWLLRDHGIRAHSSD